MNLKAVRRILFFFLSILVAGCAAPIQPELEVSPEAETLETGQEVKLTVTRRYTGGVVRDVTNAVSFTSTNEMVARVFPGGILKAGSETGTATVSINDIATHTSTTFVVNVLVPARQRLIGIDVIPGTALMPPASTRQFTAQGRFADNSVRDVTRQVLWASDRGDVATVGTTSLDFGVVRSIANGNARITATDAVTTIQGQSNLIVSGPATQLVAIIVSPNPAGPIAVAAMQQFTALGIFGNGTTQDLTQSVQWQSSAQGVATVSATGLATGVAAGDTTISAFAVDPGIRGSAALKVQ